MEVEILISLQNTNWITPIVSILNKTYLPSY